MQTAIRGGRETRTPFRAIARADEASALAGALAGQPKRRNFALAAVAG